MKYFTLSLNLLMIVFFSLNDMASATDVVPTGSVQVFIEPQGAVDAGAKWEVQLWHGWEGPFSSGYTASHFTVEDEARVRGIEISGWKTPDEIPIEITGGGLAQATLTYTRITGSIEITIEPEEARDAGATWETMIDGIGLWGPADSGRKYDHFPVGPKTISFSDISGWQTPDDIIVTVPENNLGTGRVTYIKDTPDPETSKVKVTISPSEAVAAGAQWRTVTPSGPNLWKNSGEVESGHPAGLLTIEFKDISGWNTPDSKNVTVSADSTRTTSGVYTKNTTAPETGSIRVTINPSEAVNAGAQWRTVTPSGSNLWKDSGEIESGHPAGSLTVEFKDVFGWSKPSNKTVDIIAGKTAYETGTYTEDSPTTGSVQVTISPAEAVAAGAAWEVKPSGGTWQGSYSSGESVGNLEPGDAAVRFTDVTGWITPAEQTVTIVAGDTATASGEYTQHIEEPDVCIGHDYEQQTPLSGVTPPTVEISGNSAVNEQAELSLSANSTVDEAKGGSKFYYWCAEKGMLQADPAYPDYRKVKFIAPKVPGSDEDIRIYAKVGDTLGYVGRDIFHVNVSERGNYDASDPAPTVAVTLPDWLYAGRPFRILYTIADTLFAARANLPAQARMQVMAAETAETAAVEEPTSDLYTDMYISTDGGEFIQVVKGLRGESGAYTIIPPSVTDNFSVKVVVTDGNSTVEKIIEAPAVQPWYEIAGYCSDGESGEPIPNCLVQAAEYGRALSDYTGGFELAGLGEGSFTVSAGHADYYFEPRKVSVALTKDHPGQDVSFTGWPLTDDDDDGMPDFWEEKYFGDLSQDGSGDSDQDGLADLDEFYQGTDPTSADSDADGIPDGWEVLHGLDPLTDDSDDDPDEDGFSNYEEYEADTDPQDPSSHPVFCHFRVPGDYATLSLAILAAHGRTDGAAICVSPGIYEENVELLDKGLAGGGIQRPGRNRDPR